MSARSSIEWTDRTWNPITGCSEVSPGCANCYAARFSATRLKNHPDYAGLAIVDEKTKKPRFSGELRFHADRIEEPLHWRKPSRVFVNSMSDLFNEKVERRQIAQIFGVMALTQRHTYQVLTKRPQNLNWLRNLDSHRAVAEAFQVTGAWPTCDMEHEWPLSNVWLGVSVESQHFADERIPLLLEAPAAVRFLSAEPLLGPINLQFMFNQRSGLALNSLTGERSFSVPPVDMYLHSIDWVICGGESGPNARPMHPEWARSLRDQCLSAAVPFFFKQWGSWLPIVRHGFRPKQRAGALHELRMHRETECGEVDELVYHAYPSDANDDNGRYWEMTWAPKHHVSQRYLDGRTWNEFPDEINEGKKSVVKMEGTMLRAEQ